MFRFGKKKIVNEVKVNHIVSPIDLNYDEKLVIIVGDEMDTPPEEVWKHIQEQVNMFIDNGQSIVIPGFIKVYRIKKDTKVELYRGDNYDK